MKNGEQSFGVLKELRVDPRFSVPTNPGCEPAGNRGLAASKEILVLEGVHAKLSRFRRAFEQAIERLQQGAWAEGRPNLTIPGHRRFSAEGTDPCLRFGTGPCNRRQWYPDQVVLHRFL